VEMEKHPEKSIEGKMWLMGDVSALIHVSVRQFKEWRMLTAGRQAREGDH